MPRAQLGGISLYYEIEGEGPPVLFVHEFAGDYRAWAAQVAALRNRYRCIVYSARGYPGSDAPADARAYSQAQHVEDCNALIKALGLGPVHVVGLSMGGSVAVQMGVQHRQAVRSLVIAGCGSGAMPQHHRDFVADQAKLAAEFESAGSPAVAARYAERPVRRRVAEKNPQAGRAFVEHMGSHDAAAAALTIRGVQMRRPSILEDAAKLAHVAVPALVIVGDEDELCVEPSLFLARTLPNAGLAIYPRAGHTLNLEEPARFNADLAMFLDASERGEWRALE